MLKDLGIVRHKVYGVIVAVAILFAFVAFFWHARGPGNLEIFFFDVGQGDAALIKTPRGTNMLIDGGPAKNILKAFGKNLSFWDRTFDYVVMTHPDLDHYEGLIAVLKRYRVKNFLMSGAFRNDPIFKTLLETMRERGVKVMFVNENSDFALDDGVHIDFLSPKTSSPTLTEKGTNQGAIVLLLTSEKSGMLKAETMKNKKVSALTNFQTQRSLGNPFRVLFTADIDEAVETGLLPKLTDIDILKVAHHGSRYGSTKIFLEKTKPEIGIISVGKNRYGHPHPDTLKRLIEAEVSVYRTDVQGTIAFSFGK